MSTWLLALWIITLAVAATHLVLKWREQDRADHAKCTAHIAEVTSARMVATAMRGLADRYDGMEGIAELRRIRSTASEKVLEDHSIPSLWMNYQADRIEGKIEP